MPAGAVMDMTKIAADHQRRTDRVIQACAADMASAQHYEDRIMVKCLVQAFYELAAIWREEATAAMEANKKGCKTQADQLRESAARISAFAVAAHKYGLPESEAPAVPAPGKPEPEESLAEATASIIAQVRDASPAELARLLPVNGTPDGPPAETNSSGQEGAPVDPFSAPFPPEIAQVIHHPGTPQETAGARCNCGGGIWHDRSEICAPVVGTQQEVAGITFTKHSEVPDIAAFLKGETDVNPVTIPDDPFSVAEEKTWSQRHLPDLPVFSFADPPRLPSPAHTSVSQANTAAGCGTKWWLKYRMAAPERPSWAMIGGKVLHTIIETMERAFASQAEPLLPAPVQIQALWAGAMQGEIQGVTDSSPFPIETWHASKGGKEDRAWWDADGPEMVHRYLEWRSKMVADGWQILRTKDGKPVVELEFLDHGVKGYIDSAWIRGNDVLIVDDKSGSAPQADYFQLTQYAIVILNLGLLKGGKVLGAYWDARSGQLGKKVDLTQRHTVDEVEMRLRAPARMDAAGLYMPNVNGGYGGCGSCSLKLSCPVGSRIGTAEVGD